MKFQPRNRKPLCCCGEHRGAFECSLWVGEDKHLLTEVAMETRHLRILAPSQMQLLFLCHYSATLLFRDHRLFIGSSLAGLRATHYHREHLDLLYSHLKGLSATLQQRRLGSALESPHRSQSHSLPKRTLGSALQSPQLMTEETMQSQAWVITL